MSSRHSMHRYNRAYIEVSNACNLKCKFCPEVERDKHIMSPALFEQVLIQAKPLVDEITLHLMGEPMAHPQFETLVEIAEKQELPIHLTTNGTLIASQGKANDRLKSRTEKLLSPAIRQVNFSVQSWFDNYPVEKATSILVEILDFIERGLKERPELYINLRLWNLTDDQEFETQNPILFEFLCSRFQFQIQDRVDVRRKKSVRVTGRLYLHFDSRFEWPHMSHPVVRDQGYCHALKSHFGVLADGTVVPCCLDKEAAIPLGKFTGETSNQLKQILNSPRAKNLRDGFDRFEAREALCQRCTFIDRFDRKKEQKKPPQAIVSEDLKGL
jgi:organic radical activating enzyme